jgi:hypothetical protein
VGPVLVVVMPTRIILVAVDLVPLSKIMTAVHHSHPVRQCTLRTPLGKHQTILAHPILMAMVHEHRLGMLLHVLLILMQMEQGRQRGMLVLGPQILMRRDPMGDPLVAVRVQVGVLVVALLPPDLAVGRHQPELLLRPLLLLHLHGVQQLSRGVLRPEQLRLHGIPAGWVVLNYCKSLSTYDHY